MFSRIKQKKRIKKALGDKNLQTALNRASGHHFRKFQSLSDEIPWEEAKEKARAIRMECLNSLPILIEEFTREAEKAGSLVYLTSTPDEALARIEEILGRLGAKLIVKSKSMVSEEVGLNARLEKKGYRVVETDLGEWIVQIAGERPSHITAPALHKTKEEIAELLSRHLGRPVPPDSNEIVRAAREEMRQHFLAADVGISGANLAVAESGSLVIVSNEGNARLVTTLPPVHIALITTEKFVRTMEQAATLVKTLTIAASGRKLTSYVSFITGPSSTTDIEKELVVGVHGPREVHIIILDNGRLKTSEDEDLREILYCLKCGGCMLSCPVFQAVGGHVFGGPVYPGGIGVLLTAVTRSLKDAGPLLALCADCKKCQDFCPVGIRTGDLLLKLKNARGPKLWEKSLSYSLRNRSLAEAAARFFSFFQRLWEENGFLKKIPFSFARGKFFPLVRLGKPERAEGKGPKVYLFQGCLVKYFFPEVRKSVLKSLAHYGFQAVVPSDQACCGAPSLHLGREKDVTRLMRQNLKSFERENPDYILTVCPTGNAFLRKTYPELLGEASRWTDKIFDFTEFMVRMGLLPSADGKTTERQVFYHHPCHTLNELKIREEPLKLLAALGYTPREETEPFSCCGFCGVFSLRNPEIAAHLWDKKKKKILQAGVSLIATDCPGCIFQLRANLKGEGDGFQVSHTAELIAESLE